MFFGVEKLENLKKFILSKNEKKFHINKTKN